jgi:DNA-binding NtrC family response regulator
VERLSTVTPGPVIQKEDLSLPNSDFRQIHGMALKDAVNAFEKAYISEVLDSVGGSRKRAASVLDIHRNTLLSKMTELGIKS